MGGSRGGASGHRGQAFGAVRSASQATSISASRSSPSPGRWSSYHAAAAASSESASAWRSSLTAGFQASRDAIARLVPARERRRSGRDLIGSAPELVEPRSRRLASRLFVEADQEIVRESDSLIAGQREGGIPKLYRGHAGRVAPAVREGQTSVRRWRAQEDSNFRPLVP
jgi:hypothetical protein